MPIGISYYGNKKPAQGVKPLRTFNLPDTMPKELSPFNKKNPVSWMDGKDLVRFRDDPSCLPKGGDAGQALVKKSGKDADVHWSPSFFLSPDGVLTVARPGTAEAPEDPEALSFVVFQDGGDVKVKVTDADGTTVEHIIGAVKDSITHDTDRNIHLVGDEDTPGVYHYYGTDSGGSKGFYSLPAGPQGEQGDPGAPGTDAPDPDSLVDSTDFAKSIDVLESGGVSAREIHGFKSGLKEDTSLALLLDVDTPDRTIYSVLARKEVTGQRPETAFIRVGDLTLDGEVLPPEDRDPDGTHVVDCGVGDFPGTLPGDEDSGGFPGDGTPAEDGDTFPGTGTGDTTGDDEFPGKVDSCW